MNAQGSKSSSTIPQMIFGGFILGILVSYWFQPQIVRHSFSFSKYFSKLSKELPQMLQHMDRVDNQEVLKNIFLSCTICVLIGWLIGSNLDKKQENNAPFGEKNGLSLFGKRFIAGLIDFSIVILVNVWLLQSLWISFLYYLTRDQFLNGGIGKQLMKLTVITENGNSIRGDWGTSIKRNLFLAWFIPIEAIAFIATGITIGDRIAKTKVVEIENVSKGTVENNSPSSLG